MACLPAHAMVLLVGRLVGGWTAECRFEGCWRGVAAIPTGANGRYGDVARLAAEQEALPNAWLPLRCCC